MKMNTIYFALVLLIISSCVSGQIDKDCSQDNECDVSHKFQCIQNKCRCKIGYRKLENSADCVLVPGTPCDKNDDCGNFPGAICDEYKKCICDGGYTAGNTECDELGKKGDRCETHAACTTILKDFNTECKNNVCTCKEGFHEGINDKCQKTHVLDDSCLTNDECYLIVNGQNALECTAEKMCKCREGFVQNGDTCNGSAALVAYSFSVMLFVIMALTKFN